MSQQTHADETAAPQDDPHRPCYHFLPPANWMNDPNGLIHWNGQYHMFYQYNPNGPFPGTIHWGHAVSTDLVHWRHLPIALAPEPGTADEDGCWSGCAVDDGGVPTVIYTGFRNYDQRACLATSSDGLLTWQKYPGNPVIAQPPPGLDLIGFRDHCIWREGGAWHQIIGAGIAGQGGAALLYRSDDLRSWEYLHPLLVGDLGRQTPIWTGSMWECPDSFELDGRHVLTASVWDQEQLHYSVACVGDYRDQRLTPTVEHKLDFGDRYFYAAQSLRDSQGRRIIFAWVQEGRSAAAQQAAGWSGVMSLPRVLSLGSDSHVRAQPAPELAALRAAHVRAGPLALPPDRPAILADVAGDTLELVAEFANPQQGRCGLAVRRAPDASEQTTIFYDATTQQLIVDRAQSSLDTTTDRAQHVAPLPLGPGEPLRLHIFLDRSVLEIFANQRVSVTSRIYPTQPDSMAVAALAEGAEARLNALDAWQLRSIWGTS